MPVRRFLPLSAAAATVWALINGLEYYWFGHALAGADTWVQVLLVLAGVAWLVLSVAWMRRRALRRMPEQPRP
jgi:membrane protein DedA with SNARE-associated domain